MAHNEIEDILEDLKKIKNGVDLKGFSQLLQSRLVYLKDKMLKNCPTNISTQKIDAVLEFLLVFLANVPNNVINGKTLNEVMEKVVSLVGDVVVFIEKLLASSSMENKTGEVNVDVGIFKILEKIERLKAEMEEIYCKSLKFSLSQFPSVGSVSFMDCLLNKLNMMLRSESSLDSMMKPHIGILKEELSLLRSFLGDFKVQHEYEILKNIKKRIINMAYEAEVAIDSILVQCDVLQHLFCSLPTIIKEIKLISDEVTGIWSKNPALTSCPAVKPSKHVLTQNSNSINDDDIVGFEDDTERALQQLINGEDELDVLSIVGMAGQGKTTFARKLYRNRTIVCHFDVRAWCCISQTYDLKELLLEIFRQVSGFEENVGKTEDLADLLRKSLLKNRYLIVLDDMWDVMAWEELRLCFPNDENGSRILLTTRLEEVAKQVKQHIDPYFLPFLTPNECWELLQKKVFQKEGCPPELYHVSLEIAEKCKGLPLVTVLVAGVIARKKRDASWWHEIANVLFSYVGMVEEYVPMTVQLSYDNLPDHLRPCLLYIGMFPEDHKIPVSQLIKLWIAEGFVQNTEMISLEEAAEEYLMDLISNSLVLVSERRYEGKVKYCQVHDLVLDFCLKRSREENFMGVMKGTSFDMTAMFSKFLPRDYCKENRVSCCLKDNIFGQEFPGFEPLKHFNQRSLLFFSSSGYRIDVPHAFSQITELKLLKVLDASCIKVLGLSLAKLQSLIHLRYFAIRIDRFDFRQVSHMCHLETLIVHNYEGVVLLSTTFWKLAKLRYVNINVAKFDSYYFDNNKHKIFGESFRLENLRFLGKVIVYSNDVDQVEGIMRRCPNLKELQITYANAPPEIKTCIPKLEVLTQLQFLNLDFYYGISVVELYLPSELKKLKLVGGTGRMISMIAELPNLEYLRLVSFGLEQEEWCVGGDVTFHKLKILRVHFICMTRWNASAESFPVLEKLVIKRGYKLEEIPFSFADIQTLKQIKLIECNESLKASALNIKEEVEAIAGCNCLDVIIKVLLSGYLHFVGYLYASNVAYNLFNIGFPSSCCPSLIEDSYSGPLTLEHLELMLSANGRIYGKGASLEKQGRVRS